ncbi:MAG: alpha/beta hydrolase [Saprospiraceae bacterium]|nr:alpha/beta hydrolase [Saprospiraceae bacterium]
MKLKKRYTITAVLCSGLFFTCQMEFMKFRRSDEKQRAYLLEKGQSNVTFGTYETDGRTIHYTRSGTEGLPLVLMVHGSPGASDAMLDYLADTSFTRQALVVSVDRPGFGYSDFGKTERSLKKQAQQLRPLLEKYRKGSGKAILVGHSYGGPLIARMAMDSPELVDGLVMVAGSIDPQLEPAYWWSRPLDWWILRWMLPGAFRVSNQEILPLKKELEDMLPFWADISCPVTVVQGTKDRLVSAANADFAKKMLPNSRRLKIEMLEGEDHFIMWTKEKMIAEKILDVIAFDRTEMK